MLLFVTLYEALRGLLVCEIESQSLEWSFGSIDNSMLLGLSAVQILNLTQKKSCQTLCLPNENILNMLSPSQATQAKTSEIKDNL